jgi:hypothetical protein
MKQRESWDGYSGRKMLLPAFIYPDSELRPLLGKCRGSGAISGDEKRHEDTIGIYTDQGVYLNIKIDRRVQGCIPTFFINDQPFYYPIVGCYTMCGGLPVIDPATGILKKPDDVKNRKEEEHDEH